MRRLALAVTLLAGLLLGGCGIPANSSVRVLGAGPSPGPAQGSDNIPPPVPVSPDSTDYQQFILDFLMAAAGDPDGARDRVTKFMTPTLQKTFKPTSSGPAGVEVVRPTEDPLHNAGESHVSITVQEVGVLTNDGEFVPSPPDQAQSKKVLGFEVVPRAGGGLAIAAAPQVLLLSIKGLGIYYQQHTIYFWNTENTGLVPDVRYMPLTVPTVQQPTIIVNWLADGPADWLRNAAHGFPGVTAPTDNIPAISNGKLSISLGDKAVDPSDNRSLDRLRRQLLWSLAPLVPTTLELKIGHKDAVDFAGLPYQDSNAASRLQDRPQEFVVYNGAIHRLSETLHDVDALPVLKPAANHGIQAAALSSSTQHTFGAVVTGSATAPALRVAAAPSGQAADLRAVPGLTGPLGYPAWAITTAGDTDTAVGLITSKGRLYSFGSNGAAAQPVEWQNGDPGPIASFAVAPDGHRIGVVAGGKLYRATLAITGTSVVLSQPDRLLPDGLGAVSAVAWSSERTLVVSGIGTVDSRVQIADVSIDGASMAPARLSVGTDTVTHLTASPVNPVTHTTPAEAAVAYVARSEAWNAVGYPFKITPAQLAGGSSAPPGTPAPTAPFFLN